jgi:hypothetical protein
MPPENPGQFRSVRKLPITLTRSGCAPANSARDIARRSASPSHPAQTLPRRLFLPVRPRIGSDSSAFRADYVGPERRHREITGQMVDIEDHLVEAPAAQAALDVERAHAVLAHVRKVHRLNRVIEAGACPAREGPSLGHLPFAASGGARATRARESSRELVRSSHDKQTMANAAACFGAD